LQVVKTDLSSDAEIDARRFAIIAIGSAVSLTLLFTAQDAMRRVLGGGHVDWAQTFAINGIDWLAWVVLLPFVALLGRHIRLDDRRRRGARIVAWLALAVAFCAAQSMITGLIIRYTDPALFGFGPPPGAPAAPRPLGRFLFNWGLATSTFNLLIFGMTAGAVHAMLYYRDLRVRQLRELELHARLTSAELSILRMQLQPHFLFNALHTVSALMVSDVPTAQRVVSSLGDLLRASLDHGAEQEVCLRDELRFVERYLDIQRARFRQRLTVHVDVPEELGEALVPSLMLQPLVENAIRHGIEPSTVGGEIRIGATRHGKEVVLVVENACGPHGVAGNGRPQDAPTRSGVGLANVEARLTQLYGPAHRFEAGWSDGRNDCFRVTVVVPFHTDERLFPAASQAASGAR
jgi:signal transduction histidine kinase